MMATRILAIALLVGALGSAALLPQTAGGAETLDGIAAVVEGEVVLQSELDNMLRTVRRQLAERDTPPPDTVALRKQVLERLVLRSLQLQLAERTGIRVDDDTVDNAIAGIARENNLSLSEFRRALEQDHFDYAQFREEIRGQIVISRLQQRQINSQLTITEQEIENQLANQSRQGGDIEYLLGHILIALPEGASPEQIRSARARADEVLDKLRAGADFAQTAVAYSNDQLALSGGDLGWRTAAQLPSLFAQPVRALEPGAVSEPIRSPSGFHIVKLLETRGAAGGRVPQAHLRHILVRTNELLDDGEARLRLTQLKERIDNGDAFEPLARAHSDDTSTAMQGGDLGWVNPAELGPQFVEATEGLSAGALSAPFKTDAGWHIVQLQERRVGGDSEAERRAMARDAIRKRKSEEELELWLRRLRDEAYVEYRQES